MSWSNMYFLNSMVLERCKQEAELAALQQVHKATSYALWGCLASADKQLAGYLRHHMDLVS